MNAKIKTIGQLVRTNKLKLDYVVETDNSNFKIVNKKCDKLKDILKTLTYKEEILLMIEIK